MFDVKRCLRSVPGFIGMLWHESGADERVVRMWSSTQERRAEPDEEKTQMGANYQHYCAS